MRDILFRYPLKPNTYNLFLCYTHLMESHPHYKPLMGAYLMTLLYAFHYGLPLYASSTYLGLTFTPSAMLGIYALSSVLTLVVSLRVAKYLRHFHTYQFTQGVVIADIIITLALSVSHNEFNSMNWFLICDWCPHDIQHMTCMHDMHRFERKKIINLDETGRLKFIGIKGKIGNRL